MHTINLAEKAYIMQVDYKTSVMKELQYWRILSQETERNIVPIKFLITIWDL